MQAAFATWPHAHELLQRLSGPTLRRDLLSTTSREDFRVARCLDAHSKAAVFSTLLLATGAVSQATASLARLLKIELQERLGFAAQHQRPGVKQKTCRELVSQNDWTWLAA